MKREIKEKIVSVVEKDIPEVKQVEDKIKVELPKEDKFGDIATNIAFLLTKPLKKKPIV